MARAHGIPYEFLCRSYCRLTHSWLALGFSPISDELAQEVMRPGSSMADLFYVLSARDKALNDNHPITTLPDKP